MSLMPNRYQECFEGPIRGLRLPLAAWNSLHAEGITTLDQLRAAAYQLEQLVGIGPTLARVIRAELARVAAAEEQSSDRA
jgi:hypothetical protein